MPTPVDMTEVLQKLGADPTPRKRRKLKKRQHLNLGKDVAAAMLAAPPVDHPQPPPLPRPASQPAAGGQHAPRPPGTVPHPPASAAHTDVTAQMARPVAGIVRVAEVPSGPPPIEVEYVFGGAVPDAIVAFTTIEVLPPKPKEAEIEEKEEPGPPASTSLLNRARQTFRKG